jgi:hypothetical protein
LTLFTIIYYAFTRKGVKIQDQITKDEVKQIVAETLQAHPRHQEIASFSVSFRDVPWKDTIDSIESSLDIVVNYWDGWISTFHEDLVSFLSKPRTKIRLVVPDPSKEELLQHLDRLYPDKTISEICKSIYATGNNLTKVAMDSTGRSQNKIEIFYAPFVLTYSAQWIDKKKIIVSTYDMFRDNRIGAPAVTYDLRNSERLRDYWTKEMETLFAQSIKQS